MKIMDAFSNVIDLSGSGGEGGEQFIPKHSVTRNGPRDAVFFKSLFKAAPYTDVNRNMNVNGSVTPVRFSLDVPNGLVFNMTRFVFIIRDNGTLDSGGWGNNGGTPLPFGLTVGITIDGIDIDMTPIPWRSHVDLAGVAYDVTHHGWGAGDEFLTMRLTIEKAGQPLRLDGSNGDTFWMQVNDDLSYLVEQRAMCQGWIENLTFNQIVAP